MVLSPPFNPNFFALAFRLIFVSDADLIKSERSILLMKTFYADEKRAGVARREGQTMLIGITGQEPACRA